MLSWGVTLNEYCYVCHMAYWATFPIRRSVIVTNSVTAQLITRRSDLLICCVAASLLYLCDLFTLAQVRASGPD